MIMIEFLLLILVVFIIELIGIFCLILLLFVKSNSHISFKEFIYEHRKNIIESITILLIGDIILIIILLR